jgi:putative oxidoreductase
VRGWRVAACRLLSWCALYFTREEKHDSLPRAFQDVGVLLLKLMVGAIFFSSGWNHLKDPAGRSKSIGMSKGFTIFLGTAEIADSLGVIFGVLLQLAALGLILIMLGVVQEKLFEWHTGFRGKDGHGWDYELMIIMMCIMIIVTDGGRYILIR